MISGIWCDSTIMTMGKKVKLENNYRGRGAGRWNASVAKRLPTNPE